MLHFKKMDWVLFISAAILVFIGLLAIYSNSLQKGDFWDFQKQIIFFAVGIILMFGISFFDWRNFRSDPYFILALYVICLLSLALIFFFAPEIRGTRSWYKLGPFSIDPVEFMKIVLVILLAKYFSMRHIEMYRMRHIFQSGIYVLLPAILVFLQPNFGSALILVVIWLGILIISGIKIRHFLLLMLLFIIIFALLLIWILYAIYRGYRKRKLRSSK